ncbi:MAG: putative deoxynucleotide monophosphate kinase [Prokaryotic dsDNA virus sp.]|nr:MAG: putative deoxynucleotide monophosphate kinase [Prokaryotic dsDNA virus sp.]
MIVVCLNGPPRCGKDTIGEMFRQMTDKKVEVLKFAEPVKLAAHAVSTLLQGNREVMSMEHYTDLKDEPNLDFFGATPRKAYISMSEDYCKMLFGSDIFGVAMVNKIKSLTEVPDLVVITDCGFQEEVEVVSSCYDTRIIRIEREGCDYAHDSRNYLPDFKHTITNNTTPGRLRVAVAQILAELEEELNV